MDALLELRRDAACAPIIPIFHDGGFATECERRGVTLNHELWSSKVLLDDPDMVTGVHLAFLEGGSDVVSTATYQMQAAALQRLDLTLGALAARAVAAARGACAKAPRGGLVAGSLGPYGATIPGGREFTGDYDAPEGGFATFHRARIEALVSQGVDVLLLETFPRADEALEAAAAAHEVIAQHGAATSVVVSMTMKVVRSETGAIVDVLTAAGDRPLATFQALQACPSVRFVGINCSEPAAVSALLGVLAASNGAWRLRDDIGIAIYPNSGERYVSGDTVGVGHWDASELIGEQAVIGGRLSAHWPEWKPLLLRCSSDRRLGLPVLLGGCCRVYPEDIARLRAVVLA